MYILLLKDGRRGREPSRYGSASRKLTRAPLRVGKVATPRPLTHDLIKNLVDGLHVRVTKIVVTEIIDNTYYALVHIANGQKETLIDWRPSEAVAIALRMQVPIFVEESMLSTKTADELDEWLKNLKPEDFGNIM